MIAVAKSLLGGLETAGTATAKKDGTTPPFADTFQQVSADQAKQGSRAVPQQAAKASRASSEGKRAGESSSFVESAEQIVSANAGSSALAVKDGGKVPPTVAVEAAAENTGDSVAGAAKKSFVVADAPEEAVGARREDQVLVEATASPRPSVGAGETSAAMEIGKTADAAPQSSNHVLHYVEATDSSWQGGSAEVVRQALVAETSVATKAPASVVQSSSTKGGEASVAVPTARQDVEVDSSGGAGLAQNDQASLIARLAGSQADPKVTVAATTVNASPLSTTKNVETPAVAKVPQILAPVLLASVSNEGILGDTNHVVEASPRPAYTPTSLPVTKEIARPFVQAGSATPVALHPLVPIQVMKTAPSTAASKVSAHGVEDAGPEQTPSVGVLLSPNDSDIAATAVHLPGVDAALVAIPLAAPSVETNQSRATQEQVAAVGASSLGVLASALPVTNRSQVVEAVATTDEASKAEKAPTKHAERTPAIASVESRSDAAVATPVAVAVEDGAVSTLLAPVLAGQAPAEASSVAESASSVSSRLGSVGTATQVRTASAPHTFPVIDLATRAGGSSDDVVPATSGGASSLKGSPANEVAVASTAGAEAVGPVLSETVSAQVAVNESKVNVTSSVPFSADAMVAAASSMVKNGQQPGVTSANVPASKERKAVVGELKPRENTASVAPADTGQSATIAHPSVISSQVAKPVSNDHQGVTVTSGQAIVPEAGLVESSSGATQSLLSAAPVASTPAVSPHIAASLVGTDVSMSAAATASQTGLPLGDHALSPMAHTTLSATPTVLEVGVPGGTQGWLKIRAEIGEGGVVQTTMSASTHAGQDALRRDLPAMSAFLENEHVPVTLQVAHAVSASVADTTGASKAGGFDLASGLGQGLDQNANSSGSGHGEATAGTLAGGSSNGQSGGQQRESSGRAVDYSSNAVPTSTAVDVAEADWSTPAGYGSGASVNGGSWLNVIA